MKERLWSLNLKSHKLVIGFTGIKSFLSAISKLCTWKLKLPLFEDNKKLRESLEQLINNAEGMTCTGAFADANKLIRNMQLANPDVVMMDINMPGISGI